MEITFALAASLRPRGTKVTSLGGHLTHFDGSHLPDKGEQRDGQKGIRNKVIVGLKFAFVDKLGKLFTKNELGRLSIK